MKALKPKERINSKAYLLLAAKACIHMSYRDAAEMLRLFLHREEQDAFKLRTYKWANSEFDESRPTEPETGVERQNTAKATGKEEVCKSKDKQQTVNGFGESDHETLQAQVTLVRTEHDLDRPAMRIIFQDRLIRKGWIGA